MKTTKSNQSDAGSRGYRKNRIIHWDAVAGKMDTWTGWGTYYHERLNEIYRFLVPPGQRVIEIGCGKGDLLAALDPALGVGIDLSDQMTSRAARQYPHLHFVQADAHHLAMNAQFDVVILSDVLNDLWDVQAVFEQIEHLTSPHTRLIINVHSHLWGPILTLAKRFGLVTPTLQQNWLTVEDISNILNLADYKVIRCWQELLWPLQTPCLASVANRYLVKLWPFKYLALSNFIVARPYSKRKSVRPESRVSVIVPVRNEEGNVTQIFERTPQMGNGTELVFVEGHSQDGTFVAVEHAMRRYPHCKTKLLRQTGVGKGDAVRLGFSMADGDILMILDGDLTVPPEELSRFYAVLQSGKGEFINGVRLVYPMEDQAMRFLNLVGNKFFSLAFSWLLGQPIKDTLCGTKCLWKADYELIAANRSYFGDFDPFGDFDLLFGAVRLNLDIVDMPIRYRERTYGTTNIRRWKHGWLLLRMVMFASKRIKFI